jgi:hypothetical protein
MIHKQTSGPVMLHQQLLAELVLEWQFWMVFFMQLAARMESSALTMLRGWQSMVLSVIDKLGNVCLA